MIKLGVACDGYIKVLHTMWCPELFFESRKMLKFNDRTGDLIMGIDR